MGARSLRLGPGNHLENEAGAPLVPSPSSFCATSSFTIVGALRAAESAPDDDILSRCQECLRVISHSGGGEGML